MSAQFIARRVHCNTPRFLLIEFDRRLVNWDKGVIIWR